MKRGLYVIWFCGFALLLVLMARQGFRQLIEALTVAGLGIIVVTAYRVVPMLVDSWAWQLLLPCGYRFPLRDLLGMCWLGESVNTLLPVAQVGGEFLKARLLMLRQVPGAIAGASAIVDLTTTVVAQAMFALTGILLLAQRDNVEHALPAFVIGVAGFGALILGFYMAQRRGMFLRLARVLERLAGDRDWFSLSGNAAALDRAVGELYQTRAFWLSSALHFAGWVLGAGEVWLALHVLGYPASWADALVLESLIVVVRAAAFAVPGALGVQEGGFMVIAPLVGLQPETGLALSLVKRLRELLLGIPGLLVWHLLEARNARRRGISLTSQNQAKSR
jgi:putative membrane protein